MNPTPERELVILEEVRKLATNQRRAFLESACAGDPALLARIEARISDPPPNSAPPKPTIVVSFPNEEKTGDRIGRYKLLRSMRPTGRTRPPSGSRPPPAFNPRCASRIAGKKTKAIRKI